MKKKFYGNDDIITVYKFMEMCGLKCNPRGNICVSHEIMMRKLKARKEKFAEKIVVPKVVPFKLIDKEEVKCGKTILVKDDARVIKAYHIPKFDYSIPMTEEERALIREKLIREQLENVAENTLKPGYQKYLCRKFKKEESEETIENEIEEEYEVTEKKVRIMKLDRKRHY